MLYTFGFALAEVAPAWSLQTHALRCTKYIERRMGFCVCKQLDGQASD
jgi:hypothetical protein